MQSMLNELDGIKVELKRLNIRRGALLKRKREIEEGVSQFIKEKNLPGLKYNGVAIIVESKPTFDRKPVKESVEDSVRLLEGYGIKSPRRVLDELAEMKKGDEVVKEKIKMLSGKRSVKK